MGQQLCVRKLERIYCMYTQGQPCRLHGYLQNMLRLSFLAVCGDFLCYLSEMPQLRTTHDKPGKVVAQAGQMALLDNLFSTTLTVFSTDSGATNLVWLHAWPVCCDLILYWQKFQLYNSSIYGSTLQGTACSRSPPQCSTFNQLHMCM